MQADECTERAQALWSDAGPGHPCRRESQDRRPTTRAREARGVPIAIAGIRFDDQGLVSFDINTGEPRHGWSDRPGIVSLSLSHIKECDAASRVFCNRILANDRSGMNDPL